MPRERERERAFFVAAFIVEDDARSSASHAVIVIDEMASFRNHFHATNGPRECAYQESSTDAAEAASAGKEAARERERERVGKWLCEQRR